MIFNTKSQVDKFFNYPDRPSLYKFKIPTETIFGHLNYDIVKTFSNHIDVLQTNDLTSIDEYTNNFNQFGWPDSLNSVRILRKIIWILKDLDKNNKNSFDTPFQLIKNKNGYKCHPGSSRLLIACYLRPFDYIEGFYIWHKELDENPIIFLGETSEINNSEEFIKMFNFEKYYFKFRTQKVSHRIKKGLDPIVLDSFRSFNIKFSDKFITYYDNYDPKLIDISIQQRNRFDFNLNDEVKFIDNRTCQFYNLTFLKIGQTWIKS